MQKRKFDDVTLQYSFHRSVQYGTTVDRPAAIGYKRSTFCNKMVFSFCIFQILPSIGYFSFCFVLFFVFCFLFFVFVLFCFLFFSFVLFCFVFVFVFFFLFLFLFLFFFRTLHPFQKILAVGLTVKFRQNKAPLHHFGCKFSKLPVHAPQGGGQSSLQCVHIHVGPQKCNQKNGCF